MDQNHTKISHQLNMFGSNLSVTERERVNWNTERVVTSSLEMLLGKCSLVPRWSRIFAHSTCAPKSEMSGHLKATVAFSNAVTLCG
jgi:hypothetical protein